MPESDTTPPFSLSPEQRDQQKHQAERQLVIAYKRCFDTDSGRRVWADLCQRFGWTRWECDNTEDAQAIARRCAAKGPLFHIEKMRNTTFRAGKPVRTPASP